MTKKNTLLALCLLTMGFFSAIALDKPQGVLQANGQPAYSGTLPVMFINTDDNAPIISRDEYLTAEYYIDNMGIDGIESVGTKENPHIMQIRGRGNYTWWGFDKKPYRLKLDNKTALLGMKRNKHWALLAHPDDNLGFLRNTVGFELSRMLGLAWTPSQRPVEVVLNGEYIGLYMLTEHVRVEPDRVNVIEQADYETSPFMITGGWLVEIDNYEEEEQVRTYEGNGTPIWSTYKSPEYLSEVQRSYLTNLINDANSAIYVSNKSDNSWENFIDPDTLACYYIVQELLDDTESFHGSCYWHKERGDSTKIMFGPVWDFGNAYHRSTGRFIYDHPAFSQTWIGEIAKFPHFQDVVKKHWDRFVMFNYRKIDGFINDFIAQIEQASLADAARWPQYGNGDIVSDKTTFKNYFNAKYRWLIDQWGEPVIVTGDVNNDGVVNAADVTMLYNFILGSSEPDEEDLVRADVNGDGVINAADVTMVYNIILGTNESETGVVVYVQANEAPYLYCWAYEGGQNHLVSSDWPGDVMTETRTTPDGVTWWTRRFDTEYESINIIFNAGSSRHQTNNIEGLTNGSYYYIYNGDRTYQDVTSQYAH